MAARKGATTRNGVNTDKGVTASKERPFAHRRRELGLCLDRAAARLRLNPQYLRTLELGRRPLSWGLAHRMAAAYETTIQELVCPSSGDRNGDYGSD